MKRTVGLYKFQTVATFFVVILWLLGCGGGRPKDLNVSEVASSLGERNPIGVLSAEGGNIACTAFNTARGVMTNAHCIFDEGTHDKMRSLSDMRLYFKNMSDKMREFPVTKVLSSGYEAKEIDWAIVESNLPIDEDFGFLPLLSDVKLDDLKQDVPVVAYIFEFEEWTFPKLTKVDGKLWTSLHYLSFESAAINTVYGSDVPAQRTPDKDAEVSNVIQRKYQELNRMALGNLSKPLKPGNSGSPILQNGNVIGIVYLEATVAQWIPGIQRQLRER